MASSEVDLMTDRAHSARMYDWFLGGKDNYAADRAAAEAALEAFPGIRIAARVNRAFMQRATRFTAEQGITQFLDIGTGIPTEPNLHQIVQAVTPQACVAYVDNDPIVLAHAAALMEGDPRGKLAYLQADAREPASILASSELRETLDLSRPVTLSLITLLHFLDDERAAGLVRTVVEALPAGSYVVISHGTPDTDPDTIATLMARYAAGGVPMYFRPKQAIEELFLGGLELVDPGLVIAHRWRPDTSPFDMLDDKQVPGYGVVARKP